MISRKTNSRFRNIFYLFILSKIGPGVHEENTEKSIRTVHEYLNKDHSWRTVNKLNLLQSWPLSFKIE
jgi:hypothetical protein